MSDFAIRRARLVSARGAYDLALAAVRDKPIDEALKWIRERMAEKDRDLEQLEQEELQAVRSVEARRTF
jgi:hypothetical protein